MAHTFMVNGHEMIYHFCIECSAWRNHRIVTRIPPCGVRIKCDACGERRVITDPALGVR